jgi:hypothetical protein
MMSNVLLSAGPVVSERCNTTCLLNLRNPLLENSATENVEAVSHLAHIFDFYSSAIKYCRAPCEYLFGESQAGERIKQNLRKH